MISDSSAFSKFTLSAWKFWVHQLLKPGLKDLGHYLVSIDFPSGSDVKNPSANAGDLGLIPGSEDPMEKGWQHMPIFLPVEFHEQKSMVGSSSQGCKESDTVEQLALNMNFTNVK